MVDYCVARPVTIGNAHCTVASGYGQEKPVTFNREAEEAPLNLSIKSSQPDVQGRVIFDSPNNLAAGRLPVDRAVVFLPPQDHEYGERSSFDGNTNTTTASLHSDHEYGQHNYARPKVETAPEDLGGVEVGCVTLEDAVQVEIPSQQLGNLFIVSSLDSDIAQEEIVETVDQSEASVCKFDDDCHDLVIDTGETEDENENDDESIVDESKCEHDLMVEESKNTILKIKYNNLVEQVERLREYLDNEVRRERRRSAESVISQHPATALSSSEQEFSPKTECDGTATEPDRLQQPASKRSRYNSWPQMSAMSSSQRKKEQNKLASKRFRERKKLEMEKARSEIVELEVRNDLLRKKERCMLTEIENIKKLLLNQNLIKVVNLPNGESSIMLTN